MERLATFRMMAQGEVKPQSAITPRTLALKSRSEAMSTVVAPMLRPPRNRGWSFPSLCAMLSTQEATSLCSRIP